ncbi:MAG: nucleotidyltransferase [Nitrososphaerota archaeon]|jgi:hypothetical protein|nr:nucleotidyltransferase [Nitrososphaerota archaeon]
MNLEQEAVNITEELGNAVFIGALAVNHYTKFRGTRDIDIVVAGQLDEERLKELGYRKRGESRSSWYTPRGIQADFYTKDVGRIPVDWIVRTSVPVKIGRKEIRVMSLEGLVLAKHRAGRSQDVADLRQLMANRGKYIKWDKVSEIATELEVTELKQIARGLG